MESSEATPFGSFKAKKVLHSTIKSSISDEAPKGSDQSPWSSKTPEKPINPPRRTRNSRAAFSLKEVRQAAQKLRKPGPDPPIRHDPLTPSSQQISDSQSETPMAVKSRKINPSIELPGKYEELDKFFVSLDNSIRLLRLKGSASTFSNISPKIECLTDRRFSYVHLAQLKYLLPEAIEIKKILVHDERTSCMKPDLQITLNVNAIASDGKLKSESGGLSLRKVFRSRLLIFFKKNPEVDEVPEETLPEPFNRSNQINNSSTMMNPNLSSVGTSSVPLPGHQIGSVSHLSQSFQRRFSKQVSNLDVVKINQEPSRVSLQTSALLPSVPSKLPATPIKNIYPEKKEEFSSMDTATIQGTPAKLVSTPVRLMSATPTQKPQKRSIMSPDEDSVRSPTKLARRPRSSRSMKFDTPVKNSVLEDERLSVDDDVFDILSDNLLESIREKEKKALEEKDPAISQAKWRQQMIASLPKLFDMLLFLFQSINRSVFTKEELVQRIVSSHLEIVDRREVDEQLRLLQELVPEWIHEKTAASGDLLFCVKKLSCPELIRTRLDGAK